MSEHFVVVTAIVKFENRFLILKRNPDMEMHPNKWSFPGGKVKPGEDLFTALKREIKEETNLDIEENKEFISDYSFLRPSKIPTLGFCFLVTPTSNQVKISSEFTNHTWISPQDIDNYDLIPHLIPEIKKAFKT